MSTSWLLPEYLSITRLPKSQLPKTLIDNPKQSAFTQAMNKKLVLSISVAVVVFVGIIGFAFWYNSTLARSKQEATKIVSRAVATPVTDKEWDGITTPVTPTKPGVDTPKLGTDPTTSPAKNSDPEITPAPVTPLPAPTVIKPPSFIARTGTFTTLDPAHYASGTVKAITLGDNVQIRFSSDFQTNPDGPDLYVWLVKKQNLGGAIGGVDTSSGSYIDLGPLQSKTGTQAYEVTREEFTQADYAVVIWCRAFSIQFSNAILQ
jgi:Electron transfer DM13